MAEEVFELLPTCVWEVRGRRFTIPVASVTERFVNRVVAHKRAYRPGARLDNTAPDAIEWSVVPVMVNSPDHEAGVDQPEALYPDVLNDLCDSFNEQETGTLTLPTRGPRRCKAVSYERTESHDRRDTADVTFRWLEDNEDDSKAAAFAAPSAASVVKIIGQDAVRFVEDAGLGGDFFTSLNELVASLEAIASAPQEFLDDIESKAEQVRRAVGKIDAAFADATTSNSDEVNDLFTDPAASRAGRLLRSTSDTAMRASANAVALASGARIITTTYDRTVTLFDVASETGAEYEELLKLNAKVDPFSVPPGTPLRVKAA